MIKYISMFIMLISVSICFSQTSGLNVISFGGDNFKNISYQMDWSLGEELTETYSNERYMLTQGFIQSKYFITNIDRIIQTDLNFILYPNPTSNNIHIEWSESLEKRSLNLHFNICDFNGNILIKKHISNNFVDFDLAPYENGIYFINLFEENKAIKSFKVMKADVD